MSSNPKKRRKASTCHNCGTQLLANENYCPNCGQENNSKQASLRELFDDFLGDYFVFDSRFFRSIVPLVTNPGKITIEYLNGKRQRYIPPIRIFLFLSFLYFGISYLTGIESGTIQFTAGESDNAANAISDAFKRNFNLILFFYTPIFALLIRLFFKSEKRNYYVNFFVYSLHLFSVFFILGTFQLLIIKILSVTLDESTAGLIATGVQLLALVYYLYYGAVSLKRVFEKEHSTLRFIAVLLISIIAFLIILTLAILLLLLLMSQ